MTGTMVMSVPGVEAQWNYLELVGQCILYVGLAFADLNRICVALGVSLCFDANMISSCIVSLQTCS